MDNNINKKHIADAIKQRGRVKVQGARGECVLACVTAHGVKQGDETMEQG